MLNTTLLSHADKVSFHTPGHSGILLPSLLKTDVTELSYSDNLHSPVGELAILEQSLASAYRAEVCFLSAQGATHNVFQAIYACAPLGKILVIGNAHLSVYNALRTFNLQAYRAERFCLDEIPSDTATVFVTSPDYFGNVLDLPVIYKACQEKNLRLIVDSAHGSHFRFSSLMPVSAPTYADLAILSLHKTLPVVTGGSILCAKNTFAERLLFARNLLHSTSPNYMVFCSIEQAVDLFITHGETFYRTIYDKIKQFTSQLSSPFSVRSTADFSRLVVTSPFDGASVSAALFQLGFVPETALENEVVFIVTPFNYTALDRVCEGFYALASDPSVFGLVPAVAVVYPDRPKGVFTVDFNGDWETVSLSDAVGRTLFGEVGLYPPGMPLLFHGSILDRSSVEFLKEREERSFGLVKGRVRVLK